jgi:hypothetical protein
MNRQECLLVLVAVAAGLLAAGCKGMTNQAPGFTGEPGWVVENIDPTYWTKSGSVSNATVHRGFWIYAHDPEGAQDITYIKVTDPDGTFWLLQDDYDSQYDFWGGWHFYSSASPHSAKLGLYEVLVEDSAGHRIQTSIAFNSPGSTSGSGFVYSESYTGNTAGGTAALKRATGLSGAKVANDLTVSFQVNDSRVHEGYVWLYDDAENYVGWTDRFGGVINAGAGIFTNDALNTLQLPSSQLILEAGRNFSDVAGFHVVLTDGAQYTSDTAYDHRSISPYLSF